MIKASSNSKEIEAKLKKLSKDLNKEAHDTIIEIAQIGGRQLAARIEPYGLTGKAKDIAEKSIYKDVHAAYDNVGETFNTIKKQNLGQAYAYANAVHNNDFIAAEKIAKKFIASYSMAQTDSGTHLEKVRSSKGHVSKNNIDVMGIASDAEFDRIKDTKKVTAGLSKAGFLQAVKAIGGKGRIPGWLNKSKNLGTGIINKNGWNTTVKLENFVKYVTNLLTPSKINAAVKNAYSNQIKKMEKQLEKMAKNF
jgi:hypothetical protein